MKLDCNIRGKNFHFKNVKEVLAKANEEKSGDVLAGIAASDYEERVAARYVLAAMPLSLLYENPAAPYEEDELTRLNIDNLDMEQYNRMKTWTVSELREWILDYGTNGDDIKRAGRGLTAEMIAAGAKLMSNLDLIYAAKKINIKAKCRTTIGIAGTFASRLQPNHPRDALDGISASVFEGLSYGAGDALIGLNPVRDDIEGTTNILKRFAEIKNRFEIPTQTCVLAHITTQLEAVKRGAPADLIFQSIAGSEKGNKAFGFTSEHIIEARGLLKGGNVLYFETGQGSELSSNSHYGADQLTMEARCYGYARNFSPFMVNTVVGFIGPEYLYDERQVIRAGLEDHFMGKLSGLPMGCDCCYTNHINAGQNAVENLAFLLAGAGANYVIAVPAGDDIMLNYQTNSFQDVNAIREALNLRPIPEFERWLNKMGFMENGKLTKKAGDVSAFNAEMKIMQKTTSARIGGGSAGARLKTDTFLKLGSDHAAARDSVLEDVDPALLESLKLPCFQSQCKSRDEYIRRPDLGRKLSDAARKALPELCGVNKDVQLIVSCGLSSKSIEANIEGTLLTLEEILSKKNISFGKTFFVRFGRVALEDEVSELLKAKAVCILIGERPGLVTAESMSAYLCAGAYVGQEEARRTVVSNIHKDGLPAVEAGAYIAGLIEKMLGVGNRGLTQMNADDKE